MKNIICEGEEHILLTKSEYSTLVAKPRFTLGNIPVEPRFPLPELTCCNWESWKDDNSGVIYKGLSICYGQLYRIKLTCLCQPQVFSSFVKVNIIFDGLEVNIDELNKILEAIDNEWANQVRKRERFSTKNPFIIK